MGHSSQSQQGSRIKVFKYSSKFYHFFVSMREVVFPENFSFIPQSCFVNVERFRDCLRISNLEVSFIFRDSQFLITFVVSLTKAISFIKSKNSFKSSGNQKFKSFLFAKIRNSVFEKKTAKRGFVG